MNFSKGDLVYILCTGVWYGRGGIVKGRREDGAYIIMVDYDTPEPQEVAFAGEHLRLMKTEKDRASHEIRDSGERTEFSTGAVRDLSAGKGDMFSMPWAALLRLSVHYEHGAKKYGRLNYQKGIPVSSFIDSAFRHLAKYAEGWDDEDHLAAAAFNVIGALQMEETHPEMNDLESRNGTYDFTYPKPMKDETAFGCGPDSCGIGGEENKTGEADFQNV